jgi:hypothetical protein
MEDSDYLLNIKPTSASGIDAHDPDLAKKLRRGPQDPGEEWLCPRQTARSHGADAIGLSRRGRNIHKRMSPPAALAKFDLRAWLAGIGGAWSRNGENRQSVGNP